MIQSFPFSLLSAAAAASRATKKSDLELPLLIWQKLFSVSSQFSQSRSFLIASRGETSDVFSLLFYLFFSISKTLIGPTTAALMDRLGLNNDK